ncbi:hypothetical protein Golomagni_08081 [Golovinomyces magnicellulatus]|nr:hypothetical protein Golomagni_08081 [Golovinomyces magnicellulatus]
MLKAFGAEDVQIEQSNLQTQFPDGHKFDKVLNLVGNRVLLESIALTRAGGRMLQAGWLGGLAPVAEFNPMVQMESGVHFSLFHSKVLGSSNFPMSGIPLQEIMAKIEAKAWDAQPAHIFERADIQKAHEMLDSHNAGVL